MTLLLIAAGFMLVLAILVAANTGNAVRSRELTDARPAPHDAMSEAIERDPAGALAVYGTPADAAQLQADGIDLGALGYESPEG